MASQGIFSRLRIGRFTLFLLGIIVLFGVVALCFNAFTYTVGEGQQVVLTRFGAIEEIVLAPGNRFMEENADLMNTQGALLNNVKITYGKGLRMRNPLQRAEAVSSKLHVYHSETAVVNTSEKKQYQVSIMANWSVANPALYLVRQQNATRANQYLDSLIYPSVVQQINGLSSAQFVADKAALESALSTSKEEINRAVRDSGIVLSDIQIHRTNLPPANLESTYARMQADRAKVAQQLRSEGEEAYANSMAETDRDARIAEAEAQSEAEKIKGEGDAQALEIYANVYGRDPDFYAYWRSLKALETAVDSNTTLVLDENHPLWRELLQWIDTSQ